MSRLARYLILFSLTISGALLHGQTVVTVTAMAAGDTRSLFIKSDGTLWASGYGLLVDGGATARSTPVQVATDIKTVATGAYHNLFVKNDGTLWAVGRNDYGQLGDGTTTDRSTPVQVATNVKAVAAGYYHSLFVKNDGTLWGMGLNHTGALGDGTNTNRSTPVQMATNVKTVDAGGAQSVFVKSDGTLWAVGFNGYGQLGDGTNTGRSTPVQVATNVSAVAAADDHSLFVKNDGTVWGMGSNGWGALSGMPSNDILVVTPVQIATDVTAVATTLSHSLFLKTDGAPWAVGSNHGGQLGDGTTSNRCTLIPVMFPFMPSITMHPSSQTISAGGSATLTVAATGENLAYQWIKNGSIIPGATGASYTIANVQQSDADNYTVRVGNFAGIVTSNTATLIVNTAPTITTQPVNVAVIMGASATFTVGATSNPSPGYQWQSLPDGTTWTNISGATSETLTLNAVTLAMNGMRYRCVVTNSLGTVTSNAATLAVNLDAATLAAQQLKTQLQASGTATVTVIGSVDLSLVGGAAVASGKTIEGADANATIAGDLRLTAVSDIVIRGVTFTAGTLVISGASDVDVSHCTFTDTPVSVTGGSDNVAFSWNKFAATSGGDGSAMTIFNAGSIIHLEHNLWDASLRSNMPGVVNARVLMFNNYIAASGNTSATVAGAGAQILSVRNVYQGVNNPITKQSTGLVRVIGNFMNATTGTTASGDDRVFVPAYSHVMNPAGIDTPGAATLASLISANAGNTAGKNSTTPAQTNGSASITASGAVVSSNSTGATVSTGGGFTLTASASGFTPSARQWYLDNFAITSATGGTHTVTNASAASHAGAYAVALTATTGEIVTSAVFTVSVGAAATPPVITAHPASQTITAGGSVTFSVTATGENLTYQWMKGGAAISGATGASYTITNAQQSDAASYSVRVSNPSGTVTSNAATLTVNPSGGGGGDNNNGDNNNNGGGSSGGGGGGAPSLLWLCALGSLLVFRVAKRR